MLDFLRRKERRKQPSQDNLPVNPANIVKYPAPPSQPLRDRNPVTGGRPPSPPKGTSHSHSHTNLGGAHHIKSPSPLSPPASTTATASSAPSSSQTLRRANTQYQPPPQRRPKPPSDKENAAGSSSGALRVPTRKSQDRLVDASAESSRPRWGKRQQQVGQQAHANNTAGSNAAASGAAVGAIATVPIGAADAKKKRNRRFKNKHEPSVLTKAVTSDRRRSVKVPSPAVPTATPALSVVPTKRPPPTAATPVHRPVHTNMHLSAQSPALKSTDSPLTWPHTDLAEVLHTGEISRADVPIRRIAMAASRDDASRLKMVQEGVAASIITLLSHENSTLDMRRNATFALAELAVLDACEDELVAAGAVVVLIWLANATNNPDRPTLGSACRALRNLLGGRERTAVLAARYGCVEPLLALVSGRTAPRIDDPDVIVEAVAAVSNLMHHGPRFQSYVIKHGGLSALCSLGSRSTSEEALFHVVNVLAECAKEARWHKPIVAEDGLGVALRALRSAQDPEVASEASRLIGNVAVTHKARAAVRDAGGLSALVDRLSQCRSYDSIVPAFDIVRALANMCVDARSAADALAHKDAAATLLAVYTAEKASDKLVSTAFHALQVLAHGSATRRAKVLYAVGIQVKRAAMAGLPVKRLYDLRQAILEDVETGERDASAAMPESLERLSRASVRMINSGVVNFGRHPGHFSGRNYKEAQAAGNTSQDTRLSGCAASSHDPNTRKGERSVDGGSERYDSRNDTGQGRKSSERNKFKSTGRVVSVAHKNWRKNEGPGIRDLAEGKAPDEVEDLFDLPRGNEEAKVSDADMRARMLAREADGNMTQEFFEIGQILGKGGYGSVFMAKDLRTGEIVAIKRFHNSGSVVDKKAIKEQNIWKGLHHPNVVEFRGSFVGDNGSLNLVVEYVDGLSLAEHLSQYTAFPETLVAEIARQVLCGLAYLHENGVTHRDLKPANILVDHSAAVKICDFGVSRSENVQTINPGQQHMVGTPWYIAPEMVEYRPYTTSVDIWSLGCTVLELATGRRPYHELSAMQVLFRMVEDRRPPIPAHLSAEAKDFLHSCWIWHPHERPSANQLLQHPFILKARKFSDSSKQSSSDNCVSTVEDIGS